MKKLFLYSLGITAVIVIFGLLTVFGVFNFSSGKSELIGSTISTAEIDAHNKIVECLHDIGNVAGELNRLYSELNAESDMSYFESRIDKLYVENKELYSYIERVDFKKDRLEITDEFNSSYYPALDKLVNAYLKLETYFEAKPVTEENLNLFNDSIANSYADYIEAHNQYTEVLNSYRKY